MLLDSYECYKLRDCGAVRSILFFFFIHSFIHCFFFSHSLLLFSLLYFIFRTSYFIMAESSNTPLASGRNWAYSFWQFWTPIDTCTSFYTATGKY